MTVQLYFGPDASYAISPHNPDNLNVAIQINPVIKLASSPLDIYVYLSSIISQELPAAVVNLYFGRATNTPNTWTKAGLIKTWNLKNIGLEPIAVPGGFPPAKVLNCCWADTFHWNPSGSVVDGKNYGLLATVDCAQTEQHPNLTMLSQDPCAAVFNSLLL